MKRYIILWFEKNREPQILTQDKDENAKPVLFRKKSRALNQLKIQRSRYTKEKYSLFEEVK